MKYDPKKHHRRSIRLRGYDYSKPGAYYVTICVNKRLCVFGDVVEGRMVLNDAGKMVWKWWEELNKKFKSVHTDETVVMPNHFHGIIFIVGADLCVCPKDQTFHTPPQGEHTGSPLQDNVIPLSKMIQWFKTMTTNEYIRNVKHNGWSPFNKKLWQRDYGACPDFISGIISSVMMKN